MKLIIQIPCYNEEASLGRTLAALPRTLPGVTHIEWLVIDDGSTDRTTEVAKAGGVDHLVRFPRHRGLARAFAAGLEASVQAGADVIVNTDADQQYCVADLPRVIEPILTGAADMVIGAWPLAAIAHFSPLKKWLQRGGSWLVSLLSGLEIPDATSGFRAFNRHAARQLLVISTYTYTLETIIQAAQNGVQVISVPISVNPPQRSSRLIRNVPEYVIRQLLTMLRILMVYRPLRFFAAIGGSLWSVGLLLALRFVYYFLMVHEQGKIQSLLLAVLLLGLGSCFVLIGLVTDVIAVNRRLLERLSVRIEQLADRLAEREP